MRFVRIFFLLSKMFVCLDSFDRKYYFLRIKMEDYQSFCSFFLFEIHNSLVVFLKINSVPLLNNGLDKYIISNKRTPTRCLLLLYENLGKCLQFFPFRSFKFSCIFFSQRKNNLLLKHLFNWWITNVRRFSSRKTSPIFYVHFFFLL